MDGVSLTVHAGRTLGIVGESGSGKTTLGRMLVRLLDPTAGRLRYGGREIGSLPEKELRSFRRDLQMVFQDPVASLNPRRSVGESVADPLRAAGRATRAGSGTGSANCWSASGSTPAATSATRTSSAADSASASGSPARWQPDRS